MIRGFLFLTALMATMPAFAHRLVIYAYAEAGEVIVEARFSNERPAQIGTIKVALEDETVLMEVPLDPSGETRIAIDAAFSPGVIVTVETSEGHEDYWVLTPDDLKEAEE